MRPTCPTAVIFLDKIKSSIIEVAVPKNRLLGDVIQAAGNDARCQIVLLEKTQELPKAPRQHVARNFCETTSPPNPAWYWKHETNPRLTDVLWGFTRRRALDPNMHKRSMSPNDREVSHAGPMVSTAKADHRTTGLLTTGGRFHH